MDRSGGWCGWVRQLRWRGGSERGSDGNVDKGGDGRDEREEREGCGCMWRGAGGGRGGRGGGGQVKIY